MQADFHVNMKSAHKNVPVNCCLYIAIHDILVFDDVVDQGYYGEDHGDPHYNGCQDLKRRDIGDHQTYHDHLESGLELSPVACGNDYAIIACH